MRIGTMRSDPRGRVAMMQHTGGRAFLAAAMISAVGCSDLAEPFGPGPLASVAASATFVTLTFDEVVAGATSHGFDGDGDGAPDAIFSTTDPAGLNTLVPGGNQAFIDGRALEGSAEHELRVDFPAGATGALAFGFALTETEPIFSATLLIWDENDELIGAGFAMALFDPVGGGGPPTLPEGRIEASFDGVASYATVNFSGSRFFLDNFSGDFGTGGDPVPPPPPPPAEGAFGALGFHPPVGRGAQRVRSTLPLKLELLLDGEPVSSQAALNDALAALELAAECPRLALFAAGDEATDLAPLVAANAGTGNGCFRWSDGQLIYNLRLSPDVFQPGQSYVAGVRVGEQLVLPENRTFPVF